MDHNYLRVKGEAPAYVPPSPAKKSSILRGMVSDEHSHVMAVLVTMCEMR